MSVTELEKLNQELKQVPLEADPTEVLRAKLQVASPSEFVTWLNLLIYGDPGAGKTYLGGTAEDDARTRPVLVIDIEGGTTTLRGWPGIDVVPVRSMPELEKLHGELYHSIKDGKIHYKTLMIDSLPELADLDMRFIMKEAYSRNPEKVDKDVPSQREWGKSRVHIRAIVRAFRDLPCNTIFTAQVGMQQEEGQPTKYFPGFAGKLRTEVPGFCDIVGFLQPEIDPITKGVVRRLQVQGTKRVVAKDRTSALGGVVVDPTIPMLWDLIHNTAVPTSSDGVSINSDPSVTEGEVSD